MALRCLCFLLLVTPAVLLADSVSARSDDEAELGLKRRQLMEAREALGRELGSERMGRVQAAQAEAEELKFWVDFYRGLRLFPEVGSEIPVSIGMLEARIRQEEQNLDFWRRDDEAKGQTDGPQAKIAKEKVKAAKETLRQFADTVIDTDLEKVRELSDQGIRTFAELDRRYAESQQLLASLEAEGGRVRDLARRIAALTREVRDCRARVDGVVVFRRVHVLRRPRGGFEHSVPKHVTPNGGSWTRIQSTSSSFHIQKHAVNNEEYEDWEFKLTFKGLTSSIKVPLGRHSELKVEATGSCTVDSNVIEEKLSGQGAVLHARAQGAIRRTEEGRLKVNLENPKDNHTFKFLVDPQSLDAEVHFFLEGTAMVVTHIYRRE
jgi:hypothetical protein